jgi:hypothetical protein
MEIEIGKYYKYLENYYIRVNDIDVYDNGAQYVMYGDIIMHRYISCCNDVFCQLLHNSFVDYYKGDCIDESIVEISKEEYLSVYDKYLEYVNNHILTNYGKSNEFIGKYTDEERDIIEKHIHKCYKNSETGLYAYVTDSEAISLFLNNPIHIITSNVVYNKEKHNGYIFTNGSSLTLNDIIEGPGELFEFIYGKEINKEEYLEVFNRVAKAQREIF